MKTKIKTPFFTFCSKISLFNKTKLTDMQEWEKQSVEQAKVKLYPTLHKTAPIAQALDNLHAVREAISRASQRVRSKLLAQAEEYHISYDKENIDWTCLADQVSNYKNLLQQAKGLNIIWDYNFYDPMGLKQEIEEEVSEERTWGREQNSDYQQSRL